MIAHFIGSHHQKIVLNFNKRTLYKYTKEVKETAYFILVRLVLEYAAIIWDPISNILLMISRRFNEEQLDGLWGTLI